MPLLTINTTSLTWRCPACAATHDYALADLTAGTELTLDVIVLPKCSRCPAQPYLGRTWSAGKHASTPPERQRALINGLHDHLTKQGQVHPNAPPSQRSKPPPRLEPLTDATAQTLWPLTRPSLEDPDQWTDEARARFAPK